MENIYAGNLSEAYICLGPSLRLPYLKARQIAGLTGLSFADVSRQLLSPSSPIRPSQPWLDMTSADQISALLKVQQTAAGVVA